MHMTNKMKIAFLKKKRDYQKKNQDRIREKIKDYRQRNRERLL